MNYLAVYEFRRGREQPIRSVEMDVRAPNDKLARKYATKTGLWLKASMCATSCRRIELTQGKRVVC